MSTANPTTYQQNVDPSEIAKFEAMAGRWWDPNAEFKSLHQINPLRCGYIDDKAPLAGKSVLDVGCGGGLLTEAMAVRGANVMGIDLGEAPLKVAELHALESGLDIQYRQIAVEALAEERPESFDRVTCLEMLEHVPDPASVVRACAKLTQPGGTLFFSTINRTLKAYLLVVLGAEYVLKMVPKGTHEYAKFIKPSELASSIRASKLNLEDMIGITYNPFAKNFSLSKDVDVNYIVMATKPLNAQV